MFISVMYAVHSIFYMFMSDRRETDLYVNSKDDTNTIYSYSNLECQMHSKSPFLRIMQTDKHHRLIIWVLILFTSFTMLVTNQNHCFCSFVLYVYISFTHCQFSGACVTQSGHTLCDPMDCSLAGSSVHGILQAGMLEQVAMSSSRGSAHPRVRTQASHIAGKFFPSESLTQLILPLF